MAMGVTIMKVMVQCLFVQFRQLFACREEIPPILYVAISSPEVSQPATTVLSVWALPFSKLPNAVASLE